MLARGAIITKVTKDGTKRYKTILRINGKQQWRTWDRKRDVEDYLDNLSPEVRGGTYREIRKATFEEYVTTWKGINLNDHDLKPSTMNGYASIIAHRLLPAFKDYPMQAITADEINLFRARLFKDGLSKKTMCNILVMLGRILEDARRSGYLKISPMADVRKPKLERDRKKRGARRDPGHPGGVSRETAPYLPYRDPNRHEKG